MVLRDLKVNLACSMQKFKHEVTILVNNSCRAMHWCFACCSSGPRPSFPDLLCDAEAGILQTPPDSFDVCLLLDSLGQAQTGDWKAEGREKVFLSCSPYCGYHCPTSRFWCSQCQICYPYSGTNTRHVLRWGPLLKNEALRTPFCSPGPRLGSYSLQLLILGLLLHFPSALSDFKFLCKCLDLCWNPLCLDYLFWLLFSWLEPRYWIL